jgi:SM-20-related protein
MVEACASKSVGVTTPVGEIEGIGHSCTCAVPGSCGRKGARTFGLGSPLDLDGFAAAPLVREPFDHLVLRSFVSTADCAAVRAEFPLSDHGGLAPEPRQETDGALGRLLAALRAPEVTAAFSRKFELPLDPEALMIHLRSRCQAKDGRIHTDSKSKLVTALLYLNETWPHAGGRLRLLRGPSELAAMVAEVPPLDGTLIVFRRTDHSWHGHYPYEGVRRCIMFNWMVDAAAARRETRRHTLSSGLKRLFAVPRPVAW